MKYYIIAGEPSGDMYGAALMQEIKSLDEGAQFRYWGGKAMRSEAPACDMGIEQTSFMGLLEVLLNARKISGLFSQAKKNITNFQADILILIDYPGFNLRMAKWAKQNGLKVAYYISPQIWAWRKYRYRVIKKYVDLFFPILPFEQKVYTELGVAHDYFGHPLVEKIGKDEIKPSIAEVKTIGIFPGSRLQEVRKHIRVLASYVQSNPQYNYVLSVMDHIPKSEYEVFPQDVKLLMIDDVKEVMNQSDVAFACSGTLTLELAIRNIPQVVFYMTSSSSYTIARRLININYISLVNLILDRKVVTELIQSDVSTESLEAALNTLLKRENLNELYAAYSELRQKLGNGKTSKNIASKIVSFLKATT